MCVVVFLSDFLKKKTCEVQAFLKAIQLYRQDRGQYEPWDMLIGSDVRVHVTQNPTMTQPRHIPVPFMSSDRLHANAVSLATACVSKCQSDKY